MQPAEQLIATVSAHIAKRPGPVIIALDGRSGAGKSTVAAQVAPRLSAVVIEGDDFYAGGTAAFWDEQTAVEKVAHVMDWRRQQQLLSDLRAGRGATWYPFDWEAFDGRLSESPMSCGPADVVILEGAYSARPELAELLDLRFLLDTPEPVRSQQLREREGDDYSEDWEGRWREAEDHYFGVIMPRSSFDQVL